MKDILKGVVFVGLFLIPFLPIYVENSFFFPYITGKNFAFRIIIEIVFASWILLALYEPKYRPKFSWILAAFAGFLGVMALADAFGQYPLQSFWSNFERMDGWITLLHLFLMIVVMGSVFITNKLWSYFFHTSVAVALYVALYGLAQFSGVIEGGRARVDSLLGNAAYMAIYMLFNIFILCWFFVRSKVVSHRIGYGVVAVILAYTLLLTGTRGTFLGLVAGLFVAVGYVAIFGRKYPQFRKAAIGAFIAIIVIGAGFWMVRDSQFVQDSLPLSRIANISLGRDLTVRSTIWHMAWKGVEERPILGWGQSNFNFVFNEQYDPSLYSAESWFDRTHDIFFDWLIAGGILGLLGYFSIYAAALYYLVIEPIIKKNEDPTFTVLERGVLVGLFAGYLVHNLVVFDNIISYIFYASILAFIHSHVAKPIAKVEAYKMEEQLIGQFVAPIVILIAVGTVYFVNVPGILAAKDVIDAMRAPTAEGQLREFDSALRRHSFADQEIIEQLAQRAMAIASDPNTPDDQKKGMIMRAELELLRINDEKKGDARLHAFLSSFYRSIGALPQAQKESAIARELSPKKQAIIIDQGVIELQMGNLDAALAFFKEAFELDTSYTQARVIYASVLAGEGKFDEVNSLITDEYFDAFASNDFAVSMVNKAKNNELLAKMFERRVALQPDNAQNYASLGYIYYELGENEKAITILEEAKNIPTFAKSAECFISNIKAGKDPNVGCS
jgi:O-antigen ligase/tetratricopeptide (TPR) repeat protein